MEMAISTTMYVQYLCDILYNKYLIYFNQKSPLPMRSSNGGTNNSVAPDDDASSTGDTGQDTSRMLGSQASHSVDSLNDQPRNKLLGKWHRYGFKYIKIELKLFKETSPIHNSRKACKSLLLESLQNCQNWLKHQKFSPQTQVKNSNIG